MPLSESKQDIFTGSVVVTTSGTFIDFGVPANIRRLAIWFSQVSTNGVSPLTFQMIVASAPVAAGYVNTGNSNATTAAFITGAIAAANVFCSKIYLERFDGNRWAWTLDQGMTNATSFNGSCTGEISLAGLLEGFRFKASNGTDIFDAGSIVAQWEFE